jgi:hypothetical protein
MELISIIRNICYYSLFDQIIKTYHEKIGYCWIREMGEEFST